jgi:hypothetical protein
MQNFEGETLLEKFPLERPKRRWQYNIQINVRELDGTK